jgi:hypothetical protein
MSLNFVVFTLTLIAASNKVISLLPSMAPEPTTAFLSLLAELRQQIL